MVVNIGPINKEGFTCQKCGWQWIPKKIDKRPRVCPGCHSPWWDQPKRQKPNIS